MFRIIMSKGELNNLKVFLSRVDLKGTEAVEFVRLLQVLNNAEEVTEEGEE